MLRQKMWKWHRVLGYIVGVQILLWISGGVVMSWFDIETVRGEHNIMVEEAQTLPNASLLLPISEVLSVNATTIKLGYLLDIPVYNVTYADDTNEIVSAISGEVLTPLTKEMAEAIAVRDFAGVGVASTKWLEETNTEYRSTLPVWQVDMQDDEGTIIYVSPTEARVVGRRNDIWRVFDFFWMLHIMDYENRSNFNNPLLIGASLVAFIFTLTGMTLIYLRLSSKRRKRG